MIVADTSVLVAALLGHEASAHALIGRRIVAPHLVDAELAHALRRLSRTGEVPLEAAVSVLSSWQAFAIERLPMTGLLSRVWDLRESVSAYDAMFVAAAEAIGVPLVTADRRLTRAHGARCTFELIPQ